MLLSLCAFETMHHCPSPELHIQKLNKNLFIHVTAYPYVTICSAVAELVVWCEVEI